MRKLGMTQRWWFGFAGLCMAVACVHGNARAENALVLPTDINPGSESSSTEFITDMGGTVFFRASVTDPSGSFFNNRLWVTNGTAEGASELDGNFFLSITPTNPDELVARNPTLFFVADGVPGGATVMVQDIGPGTGGSMGKIAARPLVAGRVQSRHAGRPERTSLLRSQRWHQWHRALAHRWQLR